MSHKSKAAEIQEFSNIEIRGRHIAVTDAIQTYAREKLAKLDRFSPRLIDALVLMDVQRQDHIVDIVLRFDQMKIKVRGICDNMYASIDKAVYKLCRLISRYKSRLNDHHRPSHADLAMKVVSMENDDMKVINEEIEEENKQHEYDHYRPHKVVNKETYAVKTLTTDEALVKMELSGDSFLIYRAEDDHKMKLIARRDDGDYEIVELV